MDARITIIGNLTADATQKTKDDGTVYYICRLAVNKHREEEPTIYTCFVYGLSDQRAKLLTKGSLLYVYGSPRETIETYEGKPSINRVVNSVEIQILSSKKAE